MIFRVRCNELFFGTAEFAEVTLAAVSVGEKTMAKDRSNATVCRTDPARLDFTMAKSGATPLPFFFFIFISPGGSNPIRFILLGQNRCQYCRADASGSCDATENPMLNLREPEFVVGQGSGRWAQPA